MASHAATADVHEVDPAFVDAHGQHKTDGYYIRVAAVLFMLTALEVSTYYIDFGPLQLPLLFTVMGIKFVMVVLLFMHLKFDARIFSFLFWTGFVLAVAVYLGVLTTFHMFS